MYEYRFPGEEVAALTMPQLRGREGARVRQLYQREAARTGVDWVRRDYRPGDLAGSDPINQALSSANTCLYGVVTAVIHALGMSPGPGFVRVGHDQSLVYDVAALFKAETTILASFDVVAQGSEDPANDVRRLLRDQLVTGHVMDRCVDVLREMFLDAEERDEVMRIFYDDSMSLWSGRSEGRVPTGKNFSREDSRSSWFSRPARWASVVT